MFDTLDIKQMHKTHTIKFQLGDVVYMVTDSEQIPRIVTGIHLMPENCVRYTITNSLDGDVVCFGIEISDKQNILKKVL